MGLRRHPLHGRWQHFVAHELAAELSVQSTPLGGGSSLQQQSITSHTDAPPGQVMGQLLSSVSDKVIDSATPSGSGATMPTVGEIDMDENDLDIAASMMEALSLPLQVAVTAPLLGTAA